MAFIDKPRDKHRVRWSEPTADGGRIDRSRSFNKLEDARAFKRKVEDIVASGRSWEPDVARAVPAIESAMIACIDHTIATRRPNTAKNRAAALDLFRAFLASDTTVDDHTVADLSRGLLERFALWLSTTPARNKSGQRAPDAVKKYVEIVQGFWSWCYDHDEFGKHTPPVRKVQRMARSARTPVRAATWVELDACIDACRSWYPILTTVMRFTGLRVTQAMLLVVGDFDLEAKTWRVRGELGKTAEERRGRILPIAPAFLPYLRALTKDRDADEWLVPSLRQRGVREREARAERVRDAWVRSGVSPEVWTGQPDHVFRKGFVTELKAAGADREAIEVLVGHSLGLAGVYTDPRAHNLIHAVSLVPQMGAAAAARFRAAVKEMIEGENQQ